MNNKKQNILKEWKDKGMCDRKLNYDIYEY